MTLERGGPRYLPRIARPSLPHRRLRPTLGGNRYVFTLIQEPITSGSLSVDDCRMRAAPSWLQLGADDYLPKPFNSLERVARIAAVLKVEIRLPTEPADRNGHQRI